MRQRQYSVNYQAVRYDGQTRKCVVQLARQIPLLFSKSIKERILHEDRYCPSARARTFLSPPHRWQQSGVSRLRALLRGVDRVLEASALTLDRTRLNRPDALGMCQCAVEEEEHSGNGRVLRLPFGDPFGEGRASGLISDD